MARAQLAYPWASTVLGVLLIAYLFATASEQFNQLYAIAPQFLRWDYKLLAIAVFVLVLFLDTVRFFKRLAAYDLRVARYEEQLQELLRAKKELQTRAHKYSRHADKLKLFISDRLLEYIEYDERFLHFKSIAAEVRHNGVISYDKVQNVLRDSIAAAALENGGDAARLRDALRSLRYFWDLLDLATTDNIAMHIANKIYECEEHYYRAHLEADAAPELPYPPAFSPQQALAETLHAFVEDPARLAGAFDELQVCTRYRDDTYAIDLRETGELLGNANHFALLAENLVNNALAWAERSNRRNRYARIAIGLREENGNARLSVYNRGPHIDEANREQIFALGFSTRRGREQQGKGLGLYFVSEIVRGYEGRIEFANLENRTETLSVRIALRDGTVHTDIVEIVGGAQGQQVRLQREAELARKASWKFQQPLSKVELTVQSGTTLAFEAADQRSDTLLDERDPVLPRWALEVNNRQRSASVELVPLDVAGVRFDVFLPSAAARLAFEERVSDEEGDLEDVEQLRDSFRQLREFD